MNAFADSFDFSFSGVKTAVLYHHRDQKNLTQNDVAQIAYSFQESVVSVLVQKSINACKKYKTDTLVVGGGVAANSELRRQLKDTAQKNNIDVHFPPMELCLDNAAMIAGLGFHLHQQLKTKTRILT